MTPTPAPRMLLVEDNPAVRQSIHAYFEDYDFDITATENGDDAISRFRERPFDVVIVDLHIPGADGLTILHEVRSTHPETPVIVISGSGTMSDVVQALRLGAWDYLLKPISDMSILRYAIERSLERGKLLREVREYREHLEDQVRARTAELQNVNRSLEEKNVALREVLSTVQTEKSTIGRQVVSNVEKTILPLLESLRASMPAANHRKLELIEANLREITSPFVDSLTRDTAKLSPTELRISSLIRRGLSMKEIASIESISPETVATHRRSIRRKLGITNSKINLSSYLDSYLRGPLQSAQSLNEA